MIRALAFLGAVALLAAAALFVLRAIRWLWAA
jgi:hypothetical protein